MKNLYARLVLWLIAPALDARSWPFAVSLPPLAPAMFRFAVATDPDGTRTLTVYEEERSAAIDLSPPEAASLARLLTDGPEQRKNRDDLSLPQGPAAIP
ncbi:hypothetical protein D9M68_122880 [compost metagenome]